MKKSPVVHFEMPYKDAKRLSDFYKTVFGWELFQTGEKMGNYILATTTETDEKQMVKTPGTINGGFYPLEKDMPKCPSVVIDVANIEDSIEEVKKTGGKIEGKIMDIEGIGRYVAFIDTEGNRVGMMQSINQ